MAIQAQLYSDNIGFPLGGPQDLMDKNNGGGCGFNEFCFNFQQQKQQQQHIHQQQQLQNQLNRNQNKFNDSLLVSALKNNTSNSNNGGQLATMFSQSVAAQLAEKQRQEIDQYITAQNEKLRFILQEHKKRELATLLKNMQSKAFLLMRQKDEEIAKSANRTMELENFIRRLEMENQAWQRLAKENEAMVMSLNNTIEQLRENNACYGCFNNDAEDAESCCDVNRGEDMEEQAETGEEKATIGCLENRALTLCKSCNSRSSCVLFLPCRHLCSCKACEAFLDSCPVCKTVKKGSIEALIF